MVLTRSQSRQHDHAPPRARPVNSGNTTPDVDGDASHSAPLERLGRGCRVPRNPPASYDSLYVTKALLPANRQRHDGGEIQINSRYPERDAAKRAVLRMSSTFNSLNEDSLLFVGSQEDQSDDDDGSSANDGSERSGTAPSQPRGKKRNGNRFKLMSQKRTREGSIDSFITNESLRAETDGQGNGEDEQLIVNSSSSLSSTPECMSEGEVRRVCKNAKESTLKHLPINRYLDQVMETAAVDIKKEEKRKGKSHRRRLEDMFLGFDEMNGDGPARGGKHGDGKGQSQTELSTGFGDITPLHVDKSVSFEKVGGLPGHIVLLREMVLFPLLYPHLLQTLNLNPPRGVLFIGPPGTGKTLMARALANEATNCAQRRISFFMRKGSDILSKWVGESERQLSLLFEEARRQQPSIIFFDEIDGLVPVRHAKAEQSQAALVSTLLALIDGLDDRGQVIVIGATNRPDTIDPALRRPGRLDRELYFPLPDAAARRHILSIVTQSILPSDHPDREMILGELTVRCEGWSGAEIQALCTEAGLNRLRTTLPQLYVTSRRLQVPKTPLTIQKEDFFIAAHRIKTSICRGASSVSKALEEYIEHLFYSTREKLVSFVETKWPGAAAVLAKERRDCSNASEAVRDLSSFPIPHIAQPVLLFLTPSFGEKPFSHEAYEFALEKTALVLRKALPSIRVFTLHLPNLAVDLGSAPMMMSSTTTTSGAMPFTTSERGVDNVIDDCANPLNDNFDSGHIYSCIKSLQRSTGPSLVLLHGLDVWLEEFGYPSTTTTTSTSTNGESDETDEQKHERKKRMESLCYYLSLLRDSDVLVVVPTFHTDACTYFFNGAHLNVQILKTVFNPPCAPSEDDLRRFIKYTFHVVELALLQSVPNRWEELVDDISPPPPPSIEEVRAARHGTLELWRRVEYRRRQLRYVLGKWVSQYISSRKFSIFCNADLDFVPGDELYHEWRQHTRGRRIGMSDIMEKLENEEYTSLSQYHDDIDMLVGNVRTFFRTRSATDQRYRSRALELKEATVLNLYKINRNVVQFCEQHKDLAEPDVSASSLSSDESTKRRKKINLLRTSETMQSRDATMKPKRPQRRLYGRRRRRRRPVSQRTPNIIEKKPEEEEEDGDDEEEGLENTTTNNNKEAVKVESLASENIVEREKDLVNDGVDISIVKGKNDVTPANPHEEPTDAVDASLRLLRGLSFLDLHRVFQAVMSLLEEEVSNRRKKHQQEQEGGGGGVHVLPLVGADVNENIPFFHSLLRKAMQKPA